MTFPEFDPIIFQIGIFAIRWYALAYIAGILIGWRYAVMIARRDHLWAPGKAPGGSPAPVLDAGASTGRVYGRSASVTFGRGRAGYISPPPQWPHQQHAGRPSTGAAT